MRLLLPALLLLTACADTQIRYPIGGEPQSNCNRGNPRPMLSKKNPDILQTYFKPMTKSRSREVAHMRSRVKLSVYQLRCERVETHFVFDLPRPPRRLDHKNSWYRRAAMLMDAIAEGSPAAAGIREMASRLRAAASASAPVFGTPLEMGEFQRLSLQVGENLKGTRTLVEIRYSLKI
ncbi:MAG: hypothetical protein COB53_04130 [Elusimicrobia bacterium]|nr:MAG: hypothetical protein COB53_04130 [Elusimicrobiota bacterium]